MPTLFDSTKGGITTIVLVEVEGSSIEYFVDIFREIQITDLPIIVLFLFHFLIFFISWRYRTNLITTLIAFVICILGIFFSGAINQYCSNNFQKLKCSVNYFDDDLYFITMFLVVPLSIDLVLLVIGTAYDVFYSIRANILFKSMYKASN